MRAVVITKPGDCDVLEAADPAAREPGVREFRIAVKAAAVNPTDIGLRQHGGGDQLPAPWVPGMDAAGTVESVGPDRPGVWTWNRPLDEEADVDPGKGPRRVK